MVVPYLPHFGLKAPPFSKEVADGELWLPTSKQAVVDIRHPTEIVAVPDKLE